MTIKWLNSINSIDELRQKYKELLIKYHPDNNKDDTTSIMQEINSEYDYLIKKLKGESTSNDNFSFDDSEFKSILDVLIKLHADIVIEVVGKWIWVYGPGTREIKDKLKEMHFKWSPKKKKWHWGTSTHRITKEVDMSFIRAKYGSTIYKADEQEPLKAIH